MRKITLVLAVVLGGVAAAGWVQAQAPVQAPQPAPLLSPGGAAPAPDARWSFRRVDDGFVRLDSQTGQIAHCTPRNAGWACQAVPQDRAALQQEVDRLKAEVASLKEEIAKLRAAAPPPAPPPEKGPAVSLRMPTQEEIVRARDYLADTLSDTWHQLVQMITHFQRDVLRKS